MNLTIKECTGYDCHEFKCLGQYCSQSATDIHAELFKCLLCGVEILVGIHRYDALPVQPMFRRSSSDPWKRTIEETFEEPAKEPVQELIELPKASFKEVVSETLRNMWD